VKFAWFGHSLEDVMPNTQTYDVTAMSQAHAALSEALENLEAVVRPESGEGLPELCARLGATLAHVTEHFQLEEQNGYMDAVRKREPRLEREVWHLAREHGELTRSLNALIREACTATNLSDSLRAQVRAWVERIRQHERRETDLVQDAFNLDVSAED